MNDSSVFPCNLLSRISLLLLLICAPGYILAAEPPFVGVELSIANETVPPGGMLQMKVRITEPKPISKGGQKSRFQAQFLNGVEGINLFSAAGDASGTAVLSNGAAQFSLKSPAFTMGTDADYPVLTMAIPVKKTAARGQMAGLELDPSLSEWTDPNGKDYPLLLNNGTVTVGGTISVANIIPGGGVVRAGTKIAILGIGFQPDAEVQIDETKLTSTTVVSSNEIDVVLRADTNMTSRRVRVVNKSTNEKTEYYSYQRTSPMGKSKHALVAATVPLFDQSTWTLAYFHPVLNGSQFSGVAIANLTTQKVKVQMQLFGTNGALLKTHTVQLAPSKRFTRDLAELFVGVTPGAGTTLKVTAAAPVSVLGLLGDDVLGTVDPVDASPTP